MAEQSVDIGKDPGFVVWFVGEVQSGAGVESTCSFVCLDARLLIQLIEGHYDAGLVAFVVVATSVSH